MKKLILAVVIIIITLNSYAQYTTNNRYGDINKRGSFDSALFMPTGCGTPNSLKSADLKKAAFYEDSCSNSLFYYDPKLGLWQKINGESKFAGGVITSLPAIGNNPGSNITSSDFIVSQFYASQPPIATISGGGTFEFKPAGNTNQTLIWTAQRQSATEALSSIFVDGVSQVFTPPNIGVVVSGTKTVSVPNNITTTYNNIVNTVDNKTAIATTSFIWQNKIYAGFVSSTTPTDAEIIAATGSQYVGGVFSATKNQSGALSTPSSSKYIVFASPATYGTPNIIINGLGVTYNNSTRSFTNASGGIHVYSIAVSPFPTAGKIDTYLVN